MIRRPPRSTRTETPFPTRRSSDLHRQHRDHAPPRAYPRVEVGHHLGATLESLQRPADERCQRQQGDDAAEDPEEFLLCIHASATTASRARSRKSSRASPSTRCIASPKRTVQYSGSGMCARSEEHTSELQSLMRISYAVFCLQKQNKKHTYNKHTQ